MAVTLRELITKWSFKVESKELKKADDQLAAIKGRLDLLAGLAVASRLFHLVEKFSGLAEQLHASAEAAGATVEAWQRMVFAANMNAVSTEELQGSVQRLSRALYSARQGGEQAIKSFAGLGFSPERIKSFKNADEAMLAISDRFAKIQDPIKKAAVAQEVFGRGSRNMIAFLSQGSAAIRQQREEADALGLVLSGGQVEALKKAENALQKFWALIKAVSATIAAEVSPIVEYLVNDFIEFFKVNRDIFQTNVTKFLETLAYGFGFVWEAVKYGITLVTDLAKKFGFEDRVLTVIGTIATLAGVLVAVGKVIGFVSTAVDGLKIAWNLLGAPILAAANALWGFLAPFLPIIAAVAALVFIGHELYALFTGQATWTEQFWEWLKSIELIQKGLEIVKSLWNSFGGKISGAFDVAKNFLGFGSETAVDATAKLGSIGTPQAALASSVSTSNIGGNSYSVEAPITVNVPPGTDPREVGKHVEAGVQEHLDRLFRETNRSVKNPVHY